MDAVGGQDEQDQQDDRHRWRRRHEPPSNEVPVVVPVRAVLARTPDLAVVVVGARVHSTGVLLELRTVVRPGADVDLVSLHHTVHRDLAAERFGVQLSDGRRTSTVLDWRGTDGVDQPVLDPRGGGGGWHEREQTYWLAPVPPGGPMTLVYACPALGVDEVQVEVDATPLAEAVGRVEQLWPWEPDDVRAPEPPEPPDLPEGSWFAADLRRWESS